MAKQRKGKFPTKIVISESTHQRLSHLRDAYTRPRTMELQSSQHRKFSFSEIIYAAMDVAAGSGDLVGLVAQAPAVPMGDAYHPLRVDPRTAEILSYLRVNVMQCKKLGGTHYSYDAVINALLDIASERFRGDESALGAAIIQCLS